MIVTKTGIPKRLNAALKSVLTESSLILDLGCGDGKLTTALAKKVPEGAAYGMERDITVIPKKPRICNLFFIWGDCQQFNPWAASCPFDVIVSNCVIRKDYIPDIHRLAYLCNRYLRPTGRLVLRIQAFEDLADILPKSQRQTILYNEEELRHAFQTKFRVKIGHERFHQPFSTEDYLRQFLRRINIPFKGAVNNLCPERRYYLLQAHRS